MTRFIAVEIEVPSLTPIDGEAEPPAPAYHRMLLNIESIMAVEELPDGRVALYVKHFEHPLTIRENAEEIATLLVHVADEIPGIDHANKEDP